MSYEIVYDKQFIKVNDNGTEKYIAMILGGSNNCYETTWNGKERRERSWFMWGNTPLLSTVAEMLSYWENSRKSIKDKNDAEKKDSWHTEYNDDAYGYWVSIALGSKRTVNTSYKNITGIFTVGARKSLTIEQLASEGVNVVVKSSYIYSEKGSVAIEPYYKLVNNDSELLTAIAECNAKYEGTTIKPTIQFGGMNENKPKRLRARFFAPTKKVKVEKTFDMSYRIAVNNIGFFVKETRSNMVYNMNGKVFVSKAKVMKKLEQLNNKRYSCTFKLETYKNPITVNV